MKVSVRVRGEWFVIPCPERTSTIQWLAEDAIKRYFSFISNNSACEKDVKSCLKDFKVRKVHGGAILDANNTISDVLVDNDAVYISLGGVGQDYKSFIAEGGNEVYSGISQSYTPPHEFLSLDGDNLSTEDLLNLGRNKYVIKLSTEAEDRIKKGRKLIDLCLNENKVVYGITTGFGNFARTAIPPNKLCELQENLIRSHAAGVGEPLSPERCRMLMALRINVMAKGYSGISLRTLQQVIDAFNASCLSWVPEKGTVGASGDLCPLAHLALGLMGEGKMWSPQTGWKDAKQVLEFHGLKPIGYLPKEGIAMINGTQLITALGAEAVERAGIIARQADVVAALSLEVLKGTSKAFNEVIHKLRPHKGQVMTAQRLRALLHSTTNPSEIAESHRFCNRVQDAYTLRCCPQVHGIVHDTIEFAKGVLTTEINSATDNPLVFWDLKETMSAGNFHGEYPAKALDYLAIGVHELSSMSERRIERMVNPALSELPAFLVKEGGLNSGFMIAHCTSASLVSENKVLCHPSSIDSVPTSAGTEDHVSMGGFAARKALKVVENVEYVIAIELLAACQAIEFLRPLKTTAPLEAVYKLVRSVVKEWDKDRYMAPDIEAVAKLLREEKVWQAVKCHVDRYCCESDLPEEVFSPSSYSARNVSSPSTRKRRMANENQTPTSPPAKK